MMKSDRNSFCKVVALNSVNMTSSYEDCFLDQKHYTIKNAYKIGCLSAILMLVTFSYNFMKYLNHQFNLLFPDQAYLI